MISAFKRFVQRKRQRRYRGHDEEWVWFEFARECAANSTCVRRQVGAVLVNPLHGLISFGWNLEKSGQLCQADCPRGQHTHDELPSGSKFEGPGRCIATHAEIMAIDRATTLTMDQMMGCHMYVTCEPCYQCRAVLDKLGINVHFEEAYV